MYKESDHIHIIALSNALKVGVRVRYMDRGQGSEVSKHFTTISKAHEAIFMSQSVTSSVDLLCVSNSISRGNGLTLGGSSTCSITFTKKNFYLLTITEINIFDLI